MGRAQRNPSQRLCEAQMINCILGRILEAEKRKSLYRPTVSGLIVFFIIGLLHQNVFAKNLRYVQWSSGGAYDQLYSECDKLEDAHFNLKCIEAGEGFIEQSIDDSSYDIFDPVVVDLNPGFHLEFEYVEHEDTPSVQGFKMVNIAGRKFSCAGARYRYTCKLDD